VAGHEAVYVEPMLASLATGPTGDGGLVGLTGGYLLELKLDGLRCIGVRNGASVELFSRNHLPFDKRFPTLARAVGAIGAPSFTLDGEIVGLVYGRPDFAALAQGDVDALEYWVFDLAYLLGHDLRQLPLEERKALLAKLVPGDGPVRLAPCVDGDAATLFAQACSDGWEGLVAKRKGSPYRSGRSADWRKLKCVCRQEMVVGGWTPPKGSRRGIGALLVGYYQAGRLHYAGKVGTGFSAALLDELYARLCAIEQGQTPFSSSPEERPVPKERQVRWCRPSLVAEVAFSNWTADGRLRHPSFVALRQDIDPAGVVREGPVPQARARRL
jgi:bifunctional non-homologous end joining protein LigD